MTTQKSTLRERFAQYNFDATEQGAVIEQNWRLVKDEPLSTRHNDCAITEDGTVLVDSDRLMSHYAPTADGRLYKMADGTAFRCIYKLTPVSTTEDGAPTGFKTYFYGIMYRDGKESRAEWLDSTAIKNRLFGKQGWSSQKGPRAGAVPTSPKEAREFADSWTAELVGHIEEVERILSTYGGATMLPDFTMAKRICKFRARRHSEALYREYAEQQASEREQSAVKNTRKQKVSEIKTADDMLKVLAAQGISLADLLKAAQAQ